VKEYQGFREVQTSKVRELEKKLADVEGQRNSCIIVYEEKIERFKEKLGVASELIREAYEDTDLYTYYEMMPRFKEALSKIKEMK
jgi:hypothetical protein